MATKAEQVRAFTTGLISYAYIGSQATALTSETSEGTMPLRHDMRHGAGLLSTPLGILLLGAAGINVDPLAVLGPTQIDVSILDDGAGVARVAISNRVLRTGRSQMFTEGTITDAADRSRVLAFGTTSWAVAGPQRPDFEYNDPGPGVPETDDMPTLFEAFGGRSRDDGNFEIPGLSDAVGSGMLHQGPAQLLVEWAAVHAAERAAGTDALRLEQFATTLVSPGREGPFVTAADVVAHQDGLVAVRSQLTDEGSGRVIAYGFARYRIAD